MRERPIIFSDAMVRAILDGRKTQTRRVVKPQPDEDGLSRILPLGQWQDTSGRDYRNRYGQPGDRLWVRETWAPVKIFGQSPIGESYTIDYAYRSTGDVIGCHRWRASIYMPRAASRIMLEVTGVRVERVQDIGTDDATAEGWQRRPDISSDPQVHDEAARDWFMDLWNSVNAARGFGWDVNPWVWIIEFKRLQPC